MCAWYFFHPSDKICSMFRGLCFEMGRNSNQPTHCASDWVNHRESPRLIIGSSVLISFFEGYTYFYPQRTFQKWVGSKPFIAARSRCSWSYRILHVFTVSTIVIVVFGRCFVQCHGWFLQKPTQPWLRFPRTAATGKCGGGFRCWYSEVIDPGYGGFLIWGYPQMVGFRKSHKNGWFGGTHIYGNTHMAW